MGTANPEQAAPLCVPITDRPMALLREMMVRAIAPLVSSSSMSRTNDLSIFNWSRGSFFR